ncbi:LysR family transcriptional regulator [Geodermatophilus sabuli]|uniref:Transcriptional regulator, LysR family n=1 Tax=Geodermatophilus sabuli TaxID=1564158 RepID=A0A285EE17_9ACTN|nr:LysR family transcriptional regulator [Geodermatophilus sabuli]MBB3084416.1 DNA-binding transcriptional LysR family regulator [Geodermatophilus sabuli]SNX96316.1 transcriptional regulator, LysR family [Geodermatophilus sabuli]
MTPRPRFTLAQLQYFVSAAEAGNISAAAARLHTSQSGMSTAIQRLERDLGCALFIRHHARGITLTASGRQLLDKARDLLREAGELQELGQDLQSGTTGRLTAGFFVTLAPVYVPRILPRLRAAHPGLTVEVLEADGVTLHQALRTGACDIALTYGLDIADDMTFETVARARPYALLSEHHPVAGRSTATLGELAQTPMVLLDLPEPAHVMLGMFERAGVTPPEIIRTTSLETMRGLVAAGDGFAIVNQRLRPQGPFGAEVHTVEIAEAEEVALGLLRPAGLPPNRRMHVFAVECRAAVAAITAGASPETAPATRP